MTRNEGGPNAHLNRAIQRIRQAVEELQRYRADFPKEIQEQRNTMFCEKFQTLAAYDAADVVTYLLQYARRQIGEIKAMNRTNEAAGKIVRTKYM